MTRVYAVAQHPFSVTVLSLPHDADTSLRLLANYEPFLVGEPSALRPEAFALTIASGPAEPFTVQVSQHDSEQTIVCGVTSAGSPAFRFLWRGESAGTLVCSPDYRRGHLSLDGPAAKYAVDSALMVQYALATAPRQTALFHAAVVSHRGKAYMFLGPSGTGKSTHARLWQQAIAGVELVNDDNPVVRIHSSGRAVAYGSPWSGKTPCYRPVSLPLGALVVLSQAPCNSIERLHGISAYAALLPAVSGKRWDRAIADGLHATESLLAATVPVWRLQCRPDAEAALVCQSAIAS